MDHFPLIGSHVRLDLLTVDDAAALDAAAESGSRETYAWGPVPCRDSSIPGAMDAAGIIALRLAGMAAGTWIPFVQRRASDGLVVGQTNYLSIERRDDEAETPFIVEIGGTWLCPIAQRTPINTEAKLLLMRHAFEVWKVIRVQIKTDARNERSRAAIERVGGVFEGVMRNFQMGNGDRGYGAPRDTAVYSVIDREWPETEQRLQAMLARG